MAGLLQPRAWRAVTTAAASAQRVLDRLQLARSPGNQAIPASPALPIRSSWSQPRLISPFFEQEYSMIDNRAEFCWSFVWEVDGRATFCAPMGILPFVEVIHTNQ